jgi:hypothetical protein
MHSPKQPLVQCKRHEPAAATYLMYLPENARTAQAVLTPATARNRAVLKIVKVQSVEQHH